jgi:hypothetical protein
MKNNPPTVKELVDPFANKIGIMLRCIVFLLVLHMGVFKGRCESESGVTENGLLEVKYFDKSGQVISLVSSTNVFRASVDRNGRWMIEVHPIAAKNSIMDGKEDVIFMSFDGVDTFYCRYSEAFFDMKNGRPQITKTLPVSNMVNRAYISTGSYPFAPFDEQRRANALWLVFGAGKYINESSIKTMPLPWLAARWNLLCYGFRTESDLLTDPPYLPRKIRFIRDAKLDLESLSAEKNRPELDQNTSAYLDDDLKEQFKDRKERWIQGSVAGLLETANITNYSGITVPLSFTIKTFYPDEKINRLYVGTITNVSDLLSSETFRPPFIANLSVHDSRFRYRDNTHRLDKIVYLWKKSDSETWPATNSQYLNELQKFHLNSELATKRRSIFSSKLIVRYAILGVFLFSSLLLLLLVLKNRKKRAG